VDQILIGIEHRLPEMPANGVNALVIDRDTLLGITRPIEHKGQRMDLSTLLEVRRYAAYTRHGETAAHKKDDICIF
jgi:hypothetical protein